jgi:two-component system, response regulator PdtaR
MKSLKILLVEDDQELSELYARMLEKLGHYIIASVTTGETALQLAPHLIPDLIVTDVFLAGGINGIALANTVKSRFGIPSVIISGEAMACLLDLEESVGRHVFLRKPFSSNQLAEVISKACSQEALPEKSGAAAQTIETLQTPTSKDLQLNGHEE